jgi:hypothetical protein
MYWHVADYRLIGLLGSTLLCIALFLWQQTGEGVSSASGWRQIDLPRLQQRLDAGDLSDQEASWYHPATTDELGKNPGVRP